MRRRAWLAWLPVVSILCGGSCCIGLVVAPLLANPGLIAVRRGNPTPLDRGQYAEIDVRDLEKAPADYRGQPLLLRGEVFDIDESSGRTSLQMWVRWSGGGRLDYVAVSVTYAGELPGVYAESDIVVYGWGDGTASGFNALGGLVAQPRIRADLIELDD